MSTSRSSPPPPAPGTARLSALPPGESGRPPPRRPPPHPPMRASAPRGRARRARGDGRVPNLGIYRIIRRISRAGGGLMARQEGGGGGISPYGRRRQRMAVGSEGGAARGGGGLGSMRLGWGERAADTPVSAAPVPPARQTGWSSPPRGGEGGSLGKQAEVGTRASHHRIPADRWPWSRPHKGDEYRVEV